MCDTSGGGDLRGSVTVLLTVARRVTSDEAKRKRAAWIRNSPLTNDGRRKTELLQADICIREQRPSIALP